MQKGIHSLPCLLLCGVLIGFTSCSGGGSGGGTGLFDRDDPGQSENPTSGDLPTLLWASFDVSSDEFGYGGDTFRGTNQPSYASGSYVASGAYNGGGLQVTLGGVDNETCIGMSGGWARDFDLPEDAKVRVLVWYRLIHAGDFEPDECSEVLVAVDGTLVIEGPYEYLERYCGFGDGNPDQDSGWRQAVLEVPLAAGFHRLTVGGYLNKKTGANEIAEIFFDDIIVQQTNTPVFFVDDFQDGNADEWVIVNDSGIASNWAVLGEKLTQSTNRVDQWALSYHLGSFVYYNDLGAFNRSNYQAAAKMRSLSPISGVRDTIGMMVRYQNEENYLRLSISKMQGFVRLEKKVGGVFSTLAFTGRPPALGSTIDLKVDVVGNRVIVFVNHEPLFSVSDPDLASGNALDRGSIALFTQSAAEFDNIMIGLVDSVPKVVISGPMAYSVVSTEENPLPHAVEVSAQAVNVPPGGGIRFTLDSGSACNDFDEPYSTAGCGGFGNVLPGEHRVDAVIINSSGQPILDGYDMDWDSNGKIGVGGKYLVMLGDSITNGVGDDWDGVVSGTQNDSANGKNLNRGAAPILNDLISDHLSLPVVVYNEGLGGTTSQHGWSRLDSTIDRHERDQLIGSIWLILFGTNESVGTIIPDGSGCSETDFLNNNPSCAGTYKYYMRGMILSLKASGGVPILGKVPYVKNAPARRLQLIQKYNLTIEQLTSEHSLLADPPDFYNYFLNNHSAEYFDDAHPNGLGYGSMARMWFCEMIPNIVPGFKPPYCSDY